MDPNPADVEGGRSGWFLMRGRKPCHSGAPAQATRTRAIWHVDRCQQPGMRCVVASFAAPNARGVAKGGQCAVKRCWVLKVVAEFSVTARARRARISQEGGRIGAVRDGRGQEVYLVAPVFQLPQSESSAKTVS